jgi:WD40 repeat protein
VAGLSNTQWDDRLACINFPQGQTSAVCHGDEFFAVGLTTGTVALYHVTSFQEYKIINHGEAVKFLRFKSKSDLMASCGVKTINIWDIRCGQIIHCFKAPQRPIYLSFDKNLLIVASERNYLASWDMENDGAQLPDRPWNDSAEHLNRPLRRPPRAISLSAGLKFLAVAYSGQPITIWDLEADMYYGTCGKKLLNGETTTFVVSALVFKPNVNYNLLAVSYLDGELVLLDPLADQELERLHANCHTLAASPDGRLLAGGAGFGTIQIYEFDTLRLLYRVKSSNFYIKHIAFSRDNLLFADIRGSQCNIWEPAVLLRDLVGDDSSDVTSTSVVEAVAHETKVKISVMILHPTEEVAFCGKEDGSVSVYDLKTGAQLQTLYRHKSLVRIVTWWSKSDLIMSIDASNGILIWKLKNMQQHGWVAEKVQFQSRLDCGRSIIQVLLNETAGKFILTTRESDHLWSIDGNQQYVRACPEAPATRKWIQHPQSLLHMICIDGSTARVYTWSDWSEIAYLRLGIDTKGLQLRTVTLFTSKHKQRILLELSELDGSAHTRALHLLDAMSFSLTHPSTTEDVTPTSDTKKGASKAPIKIESVDPVITSPLLVSLTSCVAQVVGFHDTGKLIFLDTHSWVCSSDLEDPGTGSVSYIRHFFVPYDWLSGIRDVICAISKRNVLFARNDDVVIVKGGLEHVEMVEKVCVKTETEKTK